MGEQNESAKWGELEEQEKLDELFEQGRKRYETARAAYEKLLKLDKAELKEAGSYFGGIEAIGEFGFPQIEEAIKGYKEKDDKVVYAVRLDQLSKGLESQVRQLEALTKPEDKKK